MLLPVYSSPPPEIVVVALKSTNSGLNRSSAVTVDVASGARAVDLVQDLVPVEQFQPSPDMEATSQPEARVRLIGHSFGGHAFGLLPNHRKVARFYTFATGAGWHGWMPALEQWKVKIMWNILGPLMTRWKGYLAWSKLGMGEDLPLDVYSDWKRWCSYPRYFFDDPSMGDQVQDLFDDVTTPIVAANATDDLWAPPASRDAFMAGYRYTDLQSVDIRPQERGLGAIGHMGYFRRQAQPLWEDALQWFGEYRKPPLPV